MRYPIIGTTIKQVKNAGGAEIKETHSTGIYLNRCTIWLAVQCEAFPFLSRGYLDIAPLKSYK